MKSKQASDVAKDVRKHVQHKSHGGEMSSCPSCGGDTQLNGQSTDFLDSPSFEEDPQEFSATYPDPDETEGEVSSRGPNKHSLLSDIMKKRLGRK